MKRGLSLIGFAAMLVLAASVRADVLQTLWTPELTLEQLEWRSRSDAPAAEARAISESVRRALRERRAQIRECVREIEMPANAAQWRVRRFTVVLLFASSPQPRVAAEASDELRALAQCVVIAAGSIHARTPSGNVVVRAVYRVRRAGRYDLLGH